MSITGELSAWLSTLSVVVLVALALAALVAPAASAAAKRLRFAGIASVGALALVATVWQAWAASDLARLKQQISLTLEAQVKSLQEQVAKLEDSTRIRSFSTDTATSLADYLRTFGSRKIVVSCAPNDIEAYRYATQIANVLKAAGWDARGPETTTIFGDVRAMGINIYDNRGHGSDTAKILLGALSKFGIPYQSRVPPSEAMPDNEAVELFIGAKPGQPALATGVSAH
jgi:hypothetical protein